MVFSLDVTHPPASASSSSPPPALCPPHILPPPNLSYLSLLTSFQMWIPALLESRVMPPVLGLFVSWYFLLSALLPCSHWLSCPCTHHLRLHLLPSSFPSLSCILVTKGDSILVSGIEKPKKKRGGVVALAISQPLLCQKPQLLCFTGHMPNPQSGPPSLSCYVSKAGSAARCCPCKTEGSILSEITGLWLSTELQSPVL